MGNPFHKGNLALVLYYAFALCLLSSAIAVAGYEQKQYIDPYNGKYPQPQVKKNDLLQNHGLHLPYSSYKSPSKHVKQLPYYYSRSLSPPEHVKQLPHYSNVLPSPKYVKHLLYYKPLPVPKYVKNRPKHYYRYPLSLNRVKNPSFSYISPPPAYYYKSPPPPSPSPPPPYYYNSPPPPPHLYFK